MRFIAALCFLSLISLAATQFAKAGCDVANIRKILDHFVPSPAPGYKAQLDATAIRAIESGSNVVPVSSKVYWRSRNGNNVLREVRINLDLKFGRRVSDGNGLSVRFGIEHGEKGDVVGSLDGFIQANHPTVFEMGMVKVKEEVRSQGLQDLLFEALIRRHPKIDRISSVNYIQSNLEVFVEKINSKALAHPRFHELNQGPECCRKFLDALHLESPQEFKELIQSAVRETPTYKGFERLGFQKICDWQFSSGRWDLDSIVVQFDLCK